MEFKIPRKTEISRGRDGTTWSSEQARAVLHRETIPPENCKFCTKPHKGFAESWPEGETRKNRKTLLTVRKSQNQARGVSPQAIKKKNKERKETKTRLTLSRNSSRRRRDWIRSRLLWSYNHRPSGQ